MAPIHIEILLHYHCNMTDDYRGGDFSAPAVQEAMGWFVAAGLLKRRDDPRVYSMYETTDRARALIDAWCNTPLPVQVWVIPKAEGPV